MSRSFARFAGLSMAAVFVAVVAPAPAAAQAPVVTPAGDPSVNPDSIYRLAVDSTKYPNEPFVYLLDDGIITFEADGRARTTYRQIVQVLTREAAEQWGEQSFGYASDRQKLTINWIRVVRPDGSVISDKPLHEQESVAPVAQEAPIYSDTKIHRVSIGGIVPGTLLDFSYTTEDLTPVVPGDFWTGWRTTTGRFTRRSRLIVDVPASLTPRIDERNVHFKRIEQVAHGRHVYIWATTDVPKLDPEPFAADSNDVNVTINVSAPITWGDIAKWYAGLSKDRYALTPAIDSALSAVLAGSKTRDDSLRAVHRWVAQDFRYVSLSLGQGSVRPRTPAEVFAAKYGDCKDKATFFIALLKRMGVPAYPVLLNSSGGVQREEPTLKQFDHMIAAIDRGNRYTFVDLTSDLTPFGQIPPAEEGEFGLVVHPDGRGEVVTFPADPLTANRSETVITGEITPTGGFHGSYVEKRSGSRQYSLRGPFSSKFSDTQRDRMVSSMANEVFEGSRGDSLTMFDGRDLQAEPKISFAIQSDKVLNDAGGVSILTLPLPVYATPSLIANLEGRGPRRYPIDAEAVIGSSETVSEMRLTLPEGWHAQIPPDVADSSVFGSYEAHYRQDGRVVDVTRRMRGAKGIYPPSRYRELIDWLQGVGKDDVKYLVLNKH